MYDRLGETTIVADRYACRMTTRSWTPSSCYAAPAKSAMIT